LTDARDARVEPPPLDHTLTLIVARRSGKRAVGGQVAVADDARDALSESAGHAREQHATLEARPYDPDAQLEAGEYFRVARSEVEDSMGVLELLARGPESEALDVSAISQRPQLFYAVVTGGNPDARVAYVTRSNPAKVARSGHFFTPKGQVLTRVESPVLLFEDRVDLIVTRDDIVINNQSTFEQWFRDTPAVQERVGEWVSSITAHLPVDADGAARLEAQAREYPRLRRMLYSIHSRGHLKDVPMRKIRAHIKSQGLDARQLLKGDRLLVDEADPTTLLKLLNEDLFRGGLTDELFAADRKRRRS
jgi:hypothetical protein